VAKGSERVAPSHLDAGDASAGRSASVSGPAKPAESEPVNASGAIPSGVKPGWKPTPARGDGTIWQAEGGNLNENSMRIMNPGSDPRYPNGYVKFFNSHNQPLDINGKPGGRADTHFPRRPDGSYDLPNGW
jgi:hypothetical protein